MSGSTAGLLTCTVGGAKGNHLVGVPRGGACLPRAITDAISKVWFRAVADDIAGAAAKLTLGDAEHVTNAGSLMPGQHIAS